MYNLNLLYQKLLETDYKGLDKLEADFLMKLYVDFSENPLPWITSFLTISNWLASSLRSGVWTFYEVWNLQQMRITVEYLRETGEEELADIFEKGIHDYQNPQYAQNYDYPEEWLEEASGIDDWIWQHQDDLQKWEYNTLIINKDSILGEPISGPTESP